MTTAPTSKVTAIRTHHTTGVETTVEIVCGIRTDGSGRRIFEIVEGGPTGYEDFHVDGFLEVRKRKGITTLAWTACMGTKGRWDKLVVPHESMVKALTELGVEVAL
jgi:hypothetical protein